MHCGSLEPFVHTHGCTCGPAITGPPIAWLVMVALAAVTPGELAVTTLAPSERPLTIPSMRPFGRSANALETSREPTVTFRRDASTPVTATSASPPEIRSARLESTWIFAMPAALASDTPMQPTAHTSANPSQSLTTRLPRRD